MAPAVITLTSDFGLRDPWVGTMKGVILGLTREVQLIDLSHEIAPHDILEGALVLEAAVPFFPAGTVHLAVVDPGVGGNRRALAIEAGGQWLVGPDNGLFTPFLLSPGWRAWEIPSTSPGRPGASRTFHGRDVFAPAAARLARRAGPDFLGSAVSDPVRLPWAAARTGPGGADGEVVHVDRFGNLVTSIRCGPAVVGAVVEVGGREVRLAGTYSEIPPGELAGLPGSSGRLEIAAREASAAARLGVGRGAPVRLRTCSSSPAATKN